MNAARIVLAFIGIGAAGYAGVGLLISLTDFGVGAAISATALMLHGLLDFVESHRREQDSRLAEGRDLVWRRRDIEENQ